MSKANRSRWLFAASMICGAGIVLAGCGSGGTPAPTRVVPTVTPFVPTPLPTIGDAFQVPLVTVFGKGEAAYSIDIPTDWRAETSPSGTEQFSIMAGNLVGAFMTVECMEPTSGSPTLEYNSRNLAARETQSLDAHGRLGSTEGITEIEVAGLPAAVYSDSRTVGFGVGTTGTSIFIAMPDCAWAIRFVQVADALDAAAYRSLFGRVVSTFRPGARGE